MAGVNRSADSLDESCKKLGQENDSYCDSDVESIKSLQADTTVSVRDTSDSSTCAEYEIESSQTEETLSEISSGPEECPGINEDLEELVASTDSYVADLSASPRSSDEKNVKNIPSLLSCVKCQGPCAYPFTCCLKCFRQNKIFMPPRPRGRRKRNREDRRAEQNEFQVQRSQELLNSHGSSSQESVRTEENVPVCKSCTTNPIDGVFIHKNTAHRIFCYQCCVKQWRLNGRCPFCKQKLSKVAKVFPVD